MYIAMNRFKVLKGKEKAFEDVWLSRESYLDQLDGFVSFYMLRGPDRDGHTLYSSHTVWENFDHFEAWTKSEQFRKAHASAGSNDKLYDGHPEFEGFTVFQKVYPSKGNKDAA